MSKGTSGNFGQHLGTGNGSAGAMGSTVSLQSIRYSCFTNDHFGMLLKFFQLRVSQTILFAFVQSIFLLITSSYPGTAQSRDSRRRDRDRRYSRSNSFEYESGAGNGSGGSDPFNRRNRVPSIGSSSSSRRTRSESPRDSRRYINLWISL